MDNLICRDSCPLNCSRVYVRAKRKLQRNTWRVNNWLQIVCLVSQADHGSVRVMISPIEIDRKLWRAAKLACTCVEKTILLAEPLGEQ